MGSRFLRGSGKSQIQASPCHIISTHGPLAPDDLCGRGRMTKSLQSQGMAVKTEHPESDVGVSQAARGAAVYTPLTLALYDLVVLGFSNSLVWKCSSRLILDFYNQHISGKHLDVGVGTGYFLDRCRFPTSTPAITLLDLNPGCLRATARRLRRYAPSRHLGNVLEPIEIARSGFDSVGLNYLLHCLPGNLCSKSVVFEHLKPLLSDCGVVFGSTILGKDVGRSLPARTLMKLYNAKGIFSNSSDCRQDLEAGLTAHFREYTVRVEGCVALFSARKPRMDQIM